jgi:glutamate dehydrogenase (NADP+)
MSDSKGTIHDAEGITAEKLAYIMDLKNVQRGRISEYASAHSSATFLEGQRPWGVSVDVALPCATQNELDGNEANTLLANGCVCVAEGANMPSTPEAIEAFHSAGILFAPGKASNAGGVATSGLEMSQNSLRYNWTREEVDAKLHRIMKDIHEQCVSYGTNDDGSVDYVRGANIAGFVKVADAMLDQGVV